MILLAGLYLGYVRLDRVSDLWTTGYGRVLLVKSALFGLALGWGALHHFVLRPRLERSQEIAPAGIRRSLLAESLVGVAVLLAAAVLVDSRPPTASAAVRSPRRRCSSTRASSPTGSPLRAAACGRAGSAAATSSGSTRRPRTVTKRVEVGPRVFNLAPAPGAVWAISNTLGTASRIDARTAKVTATVHVGLQPYDVEWGFGSAWVSNAGDGTVSRITGTRSCARSTSAGSRTALTAYGGFLYVTDHRGGRVLRVDPQTNQRGRERQACRAPTGSPGLGNSLYVSQETNAVTRLDATTLRVTGHGRGRPQSARVGDRRRPPLGAVHRRRHASWSSIRRRLKVVRRFPAGAGPIVALPAFGHTWVSHSTGLKVAIRYEQEPSEPGRRTRVRRERRRSRAQRRSATRQIADGSV